MSNKPAKLIIHPCTEATRSAFSDNRSASRAARAHRCRLPPYFASSFKKKAHKKSDRGSRLTAALLRDAPAPACQRCATIFRAHAPQHPHHQVHAADVPAPQSVRAVPPRRQHLLPVHRDSQLDPCGAAPRPFARPLTSGPDHGVPQRNFHDPARVRAVGGAKPLMGKQPHTCR